MVSDGCAVSAFWRVRPEGLTSSVHSVAGKDQIQLSSRHLPLWECDTEGRGDREGAHALARRREVVPA